jgi:hypothetical protein
MPGKIYFRDGQITVTSAEIVVGQQIFPISEILSARAIRRRTLFPLIQSSSFALLITTAAGEIELLRGRNGYVVFQLEKAIEGALRSAKLENPRFSSDLGAAASVVSAMPEAVANSLQSLEETKLAS